MKLLHIAYNRDLYRFNLDDAGHPIHIDVAKAGHTGEWHPIPYESLPSKVIEELSSKTVVQFGELPDML